MDKAFEITTDLVAGARDWQPQRQYGFTRVPVMDVVELNCDNALVRARLRLDRAYSSKVLPFISVGVT